MAGATLAEVAALLGAAGALVDVLCHGEPCLTMALRQAIAAANRIPLVEWSAAHNATALKAALEPRAAAAGPAPVQADPRLPDGLLTRRCRRPRAIPPAGSVLALARTDAAEAQERLLQPLTSLLRRGRIDGFTLLLDTGDGNAPEVAHHGQVDASGRYDAVLVGGDLDRSFAQAVALGTGGYALDLPAGVPVEEMPATLQRLARAAAALAAPSAAVLADALAVLPVAERPAVVAPPHLEFHLSVPSRGGRPTALVIDASNGLLLDSAKEAVLSAVMQATERFGLPLLWYGPSDPDFERNVPSLRPMAARGARDVALELLRADALLPLAPLEGPGDGIVGRRAALQTDAAMVLFGGTGHAGIYSAVGPYAASSLSAGLCVPNTADAWLDAIAGMVEGTAEAPVDAAAVCAERGVDHLADACWAPLIAAAAAPQPVSLPALLELRLTVADLAHRLPFSEAAYLERHPDVGAAVAAGEFASGYDHFIKHGYAEGRMPEFVPADTVAVDSLVKAEIPGCEGSLREAEHIAAQIERMLSSLPR
ncbi:hypothetical protein [Azospirillum sp. sgz301742]